MLNTFALALQTSGIPQVEPLPLPAPHWLLWGLLLFTFLLHVIPMNLLLGGSLLAAWSRLRIQKDPENLGKLYDWFKKMMPVVVAATITFGVAPLLFVQTLYGRLLYSSSVLMAWYWFSVIPILILAYYGTYLLAFKSKNLGSKTLAVSWIIAGLLMVIAFIYTNNMSLMLRPEVFVEKYQSGAGGWHLNLDDPTLIPRYVHNLLSAIAVASLAVSLFGLLKLKTDESFGKWAIRRGSIWFGAVTLVNMGAGLWYLFSLDREVIRAIMNPIGATGLMLGILGGLVAIFLVMQAMNAAKPKLPVLGAAGALFVSLISMLLLRDQLRQIRLSLSGYEIMPWVDTDWGLIGLFVVLLLVAVGTVLWMVAVLLKKRG